MLANVTEEQLATADSLPAAAVRTLYVLSMRNFDDVYSHIRSKLESLTKATDDNEGAVSGPSRGVLRIACL